MTCEPILEVKNLSISFEKKVVDGVSFQVYPGQTTAIVGESGSGKTISSMALMGLLPDSATVEAGELTKLKKGVEISMIFQDPMSSLNPSMTVGEQVAEPLIVHENLPKETAAKKVVDLFKEVGFLILMRLSINILMSLVEAKNNAS